jgi:O-antigen ligase
MNGAAAAAAPAVPPRLVWAFLLLLVLPFDPHWLDAEQARRGLLLALGGAALLLRRPRAIAGERWWWLFLGALLLAAAVAWGTDRGELRAFQPHDAAFRLAHFAALLVALRLGAASAPATSGAAFAALLAATSAFGVLQRLGLAALGGYGVEREPVSVFGNLNVAAEWTAIAGTVVAVLLPELGGRARRGAMLALLLGGAYAVVNGSRSGLVALPLGLLLVAWRHRGQGRWLPCALATSGAGAGLLLSALAPLPPAAPTPATTAARGAATLEVRLEIAKGALQLANGAPVTGLGPGQFAVHYPRVRSEREIELSSHGRQFATEVRTAHDDWLELLAEGGALGLALFAAALVALARAQPDRRRLAPLLVLLALMLVRSPLANAPAAVAAFWLVGMPRPAGQPLARWLALVLGLPLLALGAIALVGNHFAARYQQSHAATPRDVAALERAAWWQTAEPRLLQLLAQERLAAGDLDGAARAAAKALRLRPYDPQLHLHLGEALARAGRYREAAAVAAQGLVRDPVHPELRVLRSTALAQLDLVDDAILAVVEAPHPVLRRALARHFFALAQLAQQRQRPRDAARYLLEHHVTAAIDGLGDGSPGGLAATTEHVREALQAVRTAERRDARPLLLAALQLLEQAPEQVAATAARLADQPPLSGWQRSLFGDWLQPLTGRPGFREFLAR